MYEPRLTRRDRAVTFSMVVAVHVALAFALINLSPPIRQALPEQVVEMFDVTPPPPPEEIVVEQIPTPKDSPKEEEGAASPKNIRSQATPVVAPKPPIALPIPPPMPVTQTPNTGSERTQGASNVLGPGTGAG
ncbi:MAG: energy transducer TonB, partial [Sphingomicrobium sp.]